jgi:cytochrome P450
MLRLFLFLVRLDWPLRLLGPAMGLYRPLVPSHRRDPYPGYHRLRRAAPVYFHPLFRVHVLSRHAEVSAALKDPRLSVDRTRLAGAEAWNPWEELAEEWRPAIRRSLLMLDPPDHTRIRSLVSKAFTPRRVERLRSRVAELVDELLHGKGAEVDLVRDLAYPLPVIVIAELLGVPAADRDRFKRWSEELSAILDPLSAGGRLGRANRAFADAARYMRRIFEERRREPRDDLVSALVAAEEAGDRLSEIELLSVTMLLLGAGHETTTNLIGNGILALLRNPGERRRLAEEPGLAASAVEELLRYDSPVQLTDRVTTGPTEIGGQSIRERRAVVLLLGAANRDPDVFPDPDRLDLGRPDNRHVAFGQGVHFCVGAALARLEAQVAIPELLRRYPDMRLAREPRAADWKKSIVLRGLTTLPLRLRR